MRDFIRKLLTKLDKLDAAQTRGLIDDLARESERTEGMIAASVDSLIVGDLDHRVVAYNDRAKFLISRRSYSFYGRKMWAIIADKTLAAFVQETLESGDPAMNKDFTLEINGEKRLMSVTIIPLLSQGKVCGHLFYMPDITSTRNDEARFRRAEILASLTTMTASVAHEIKNPLGAIGIHIQLIRKVMQGKTSIAPRRILKNLDAVSQEVERLNKIIMDFLFAVRPMDINPQRTDLADLMHEILDFVRGELAAAKITVEEKLSRRLPKVFIDAKAIRQAVLNIIMNAMAAMPRGGTLTVSTGKKDECVRLVISDTGVGIPLEDQDKIFEPYFTTKKSGAGLGLTNVFKILKEHKADISVDSQPGKGAAFIISFPLPKGETHLLEYVRGAEELP